MINSVYVFVCLFVCLFVFLFSICIITCTRLWTNFDFSEQQRILAQFIEPDILVPYFTGINLINQKGKVLYGVIKSHQTHKIPRF